MIFSEFDIRYLKGYLCIRLYSSNSIRSVITDNDTGNCQYYRAINHAMDCFLNFFFKRCKLDQWSYDKKA